jgi:hypothetical protein
MNLSKETEEALAQRLVRARAFRGPRGRGTMASAPAGPEGPRGRALRGRGRALTDAAADDYDDDDDARSCCLLHSRDVVTGDEEDEEDEYKVSPRRTVALARAASGAVASAPR